MHVLDGFKVLDLTQILAGPTCTRLLVEAGAQVTKVEWPGGDPARNFPFHGEGGRSAYYVQQNRGKRSLGLDLRSPEAVNIVKRLVAQSDVVVESYAPGVIGRLGLGYDVLREIKDDIVMCSISAFGQSGPLHELPGFDYIAQAYSGVTSMIGDPGEAPPLVTVGMGDVMTSAHAVGAIALALLHRERTGRGQYLDVSLLDCYFHCHEVNVQAWSCSNGEIQPTRSGAHHYATAPAGIYQSKDGFILILAILHLFPRLCEVIGRPELATDPRFVDNATRTEHQGDLVPIIEGWLQAQESDAEALRQLDAGRIPAAPILSIEEACRHPHLVERETVRTVQDRTLGEFHTPGMPLRFSEFPGHLDLVAPFLGEHNEEVLAELGITGEGLADLRAAGVIHNEPVPVP